MSQGFSNNGGIVIESGRVVQTVNVQEGALQTDASNLIPDDTSIPQNTEGHEHMTLAITPTNANNLLRIDVVWNGSHTGADTITAALFQDSVAGALSAIGMREVTPNVLQTMCFTYWMVAGTVASTTFKVRAGGGTSGTMHFNGVLSAVRYGGINASSITITEYALGSAALTPNAGKILQIVNTQDQAHSTVNTATLSIDDSIHQDTEGLEILTRSITPQDATSQLKIDVQVNINSTVVSKWAIASLFNDLGADAIATGMEWISTALTSHAIIFTYFMTAGQTTAIEFAVRAGLHTTSNWYVNGDSTGSLVGARLVSSITITEIAA